MEDRELEDLAVVLPVLLRALEALGFIARYLNPRDLSAVVNSVGPLDNDLRVALGRMDDWQGQMAELRAPLTAAAEEVLAAYDLLRTPSDEGLRQVSRAFRHIPRAQEALYPLAAALPPVNRFFLEPSTRADAELQARLVEAQPTVAVGVMHADNEFGSRGGFSVYVPEYYSPDVAWPVVFALHGGGGHGRGSLWTWLRDARSHGAILVAPTSVGETWALSGPDGDTPNLQRILEVVSDAWTVDPDRLLLTGMSDGGTFSYVSGLEPASPFTHLAPVAAAFHPMLAQMADPARIIGLPIHVAHGALDWMFEVAMAREAHRALAQAGAAVTYVEIADLSHTYPRELNPALIRWLRTTPRRAPG